MPSPGADTADWPEAMAEVTACRYDARAGRAIAFGLLSKKHFRIDYSYLANGALHTGQCFSERAMPQGMLFPVHYDPLAPAMNRSALHGPEPRAPLLVIGLAGTVVLALLWFVSLRGCA